MMVNITYQMVLSTLQTAGLLVGIYYYLMVLRNQQKNQEISLKNQELTLKAQEQALETRQAQLLMQVYSKIDAPEIVRAMQEVFLWEWKNFDEFIEKYWNPDDYHRLGTLVLFFGGAGTLVKTGDLPVEKVNMLMGGVVISLWRKFEPIKTQLREFWKMPSWGNSTEYLYNELMKIRT